MREVLNVRLIGGEGSVLEYCVALRCRDVTEGDFLPVGSPLVPTQDTGARPLATCLSLSFSVFLSLCLSVSLSLCLSVSLSLCLSVSVSLSTAIYLLTHAPTQVVLQQQDGPLSTYQFFDPLLFIGRADSDTQLQVR